MEKLKTWRDEIETGELYIDGSEYEDDTYGFWDPDYITEYYDNMGIGNIILFPLQCNLLRSV